MESATVEEIEKLIFELYHNPLTQALANKYLTAAQTSKQAWTYSWHFLNPSKPVEVQYFGASSLHLKISKYWQELDSEQDKTDLRHRLLETLVAFMEEGNSRIVQTRLCVALAAYVVHTVSNYWPTAIDDLIANLCPEKLSPRIPAQRVVQQLIELLMVIPEEFHVIYMTQTDKSVARFALLKSVGSVFGFIDNILRPDVFGSDREQVVLDIRQSAIKCFSNWSQHLGPLILSCEVHDPILDLVLKCITDDELSTYAVESITSIYSHPEIHKYPNTVLKLIDKMVGLEPFLEKAASERNTDALSTLYNLFIQIGETHSRLLLDTVYEKPEYRDSIMKLISVVLRCSGTPGHYPVDETSSESAFNFWYTFQDDIIGSGQERIPAYLAIFNPLYQSLIETLLMKVRFPPDAIYEKEWASEDKEAFRCYRQDIGDTFMYCYNMLRTSMLGTLLVQFNVALNQLNSRQSGDEQGHDYVWQNLEAVIFAFSSIAENVESNESIYITKVFESLPRVPFGGVESQRLLSTTMEMLGAYCEWIFSNSNMLPNVLSLLLMGLKGQQIAAVSATMSLKDITRECQRLIEPYATQILNACEEGLRADSSLKPKERARLMCTIGQVLTLLPYDVTINYLNALLPPILQKLEFSLVPGQVSADNHFPIRNEVVSQLNILTMLFASLDPQYLRQEESNDVATDTAAIAGSSPKPAMSSDKGRHPLFPVFQQILPLLGNIGLKWINDESVMESLSDCLKKAIVTLLDEVKPVVLDVVQLTAQLYCASFQYSLLDIMKQILTLFTHDKEVRFAVVVYFSQMASQTIEVCSRDIKQQTCLIEYFYNSTASLIKKQPDIFHLNTVDNENLFKLASTALLLHERPTVKSVSSFLTEFVNKSRESELMANIVNTHGAQLVSHCFLVIGGACDSPRNVVEFSADILMALNQKYFDNLTRWLSEQVAKDGFPTARVTQEQREVFCRAVLRERKNKRKLKEMCSEFSLLCRGLLGTDYGVQTTSLRLMPF